MGDDDKLERKLQQQQSCRQQVAQQKPLTLGPKKAGIRKQNAISVTLTSDSSITTSQLNEVPPLNNNVQSSVIMEEFACDSSVLNDSDTTTSTTNNNNNNNNNNNLQNASQLLQATSSLILSHQDMIAAQSSILPETVNTATQSVDYVAIKSSPIYGTQFKAIPEVLLTRLSSVDNDDDSNSHLSGCQPVAEAEEPQPRLRDQQQQQQNKQPTSASIDTRGYAQAVSRSGKVPRGLQSNFRQYEATGAVQSAEMLSAADQDARSCRSASSSPRVERRDPQTAGGIFSLNVPNMSMSNRKLSLQPFSQPSGKTGDNGRQQQQHQHQSQYNQQNLYNNHHQPTIHASFSSHQIYQLQQQQQVNEGASSVNLQVRHLAPRKSIIGKLERPSFQSQRLSDVGVAFGQQITAKMGLKLPASQERIVEQTRWLYLRYVFIKLRHNRLPLRDLNLTKSSRARRAAALGVQEEGGQPTVHSAPASANAMADIASLLNGFNVVASQNRKRTALSQSIDTRDISQLALRLRNNSKAPPSVNDQVPNSDDLSAQVSAPNNYRKFAMDRTINNQIFIVILNIIRELRDMKPEFFGDTIYELIGIDKFSSIQSLLEVQRTICQEMTRCEISWCRIVALFSLFGAMSLDCVRLGAPEHVGPILDGFIEFVERDLALWISQQGGWESFLYRHRAGYRYGELASKVATLTLPIILWALVMLLKSGFD